MTTRRAVGSVFVLLGVSVTWADPLGVADKGIWSDLDDQVQIRLPGSLDWTHVTARIDEPHHLLVLSIDGFPRKVYPVPLRPADRAELAPVLARATTEPTAPSHDRDGDGIPDALDLLIGAKKVVLNADHYTDHAEEYISIPYPMGDISRSEGVCTDVVIRAARNAGVDIQRELHEDIRRAKAAYPMVKGLGDPSIDQRRVGTLLPYFKRHWETHTPKLEDPADPYRPGDVLLLDTFPSRPGPDHIGIVSDTLDDRGLPLVINNWTNGCVTEEMDILPAVAVLYRFRLAS